MKCKCGHQKEHHNEYDGNRCCVIDDLSSVRFDKTKGHCNCKQFISEDSNFCFCKCV